MTTTIQKTIFLDYSRAAYRKVARHIPITEAERVGLKVRDRVTVIGDDVPARQAVIVGINENQRGAFQAAEISFRFLD